MPPARAASVRGQTAAVGALSRCNNSSLCARTRIDTLNACTVEVQVERGAKARCSRASKSPRLGCFAIKFSNIQCALLTRQTGPLQREGLSRAQQQMRRQRACFLHHAELCGPLIFLLHCLDATLSLTAGRFVPVQQAEPRWRLSPRPAPLWRLPLPRWGSARVRQPECGSRGCGRAGRLQGWPRLALPAKSLPPVPLGPRATLPCSIICVGQ